MQQTKNNFVFYLIGILIIVGILSTLYAPVSEYKFINLDDDLYIHKEPEILKGLSLDGVDYAFTKFDKPYFMPLTRLSYMADVSLYGGNNAGGFHVTNLILHIISTILLFIILSKISINYFVALFVSLLWGIHPQHIEAVAWIAERKEMLAGVFGLFSLYSYQKYTFSKDRFWYLLAILSFSLSLFSKPAWISMPILLVLWDYFPLRRFKNINLTQIVKEKIPFAMISAFFAIIFLLTLQVSTARSSYYADPSWLTRVLHLFEGIGKYFTGTIIPTNRIPFNPYPESLNLYASLISLSALLVALFLIWKYRHQYPAYLMGVLWFLIALSPALMLILSPKGEAIFFADRFTYLPHIGLFIGLAFGFTQWVKSKHTKFLNRSSVILAVATIMVFYGISQKTLAHWQSPESLWKYTYENIEGRGKAYIIGLLGSHYMDKEEYPAALDYLQKAHKIEPKAFFYPFTIGNIYLNQRQYAKAQYWHDKVLNESPAPVKFLFDYGKIEYRMGRYDRADLYLSNALARSQNEKSNINFNELAILLGLSRVNTFKYNEAAKLLNAAMLPTAYKTKVCTVISKLIANPPNHTEPGKSNKSLRLYCNLSVD